MYTPSAFRFDDLPALHAHLRATRLAILVSHAEDGSLQATHLPLLLDPEAGEFGTLHGHLAKANPQWRALAGGEVLVIFPGADAYISPSFYAAKAEHGKVVPTWNYQAVHAYGSAEVFTDAQRLLQLVEARARAGAATPLALAQQRGIVATQQRTLAELQQRLDVHMLLITHDPADVEALGDEVFEVRDGRISAQRMP